MKKFVLYAFTVCLLLLAGRDHVNAGVSCTIDTSVAGNCVAGNLGYGRVCPGTLPNATAGQSYFSSTSFEIPNTFALNTNAFGLTLGVINVDIDSVWASVSGLPAGLSVSFSNSSGGYAPNTGTYTACFSIQGTPCDVQDTFHVLLNLIVKATVPGFGISLTLPFPLSTQLNLYLQSSYPTFAITAPFKNLCTAGAGSSDTLLLTPGFGSYGGTFGATSDTVVVNAPGSLNFTATTIDGHCTFNDSITIGSLDAATVSGTDSLCKGIFGQLVATNGDTYSWTPRIGLSNATIANPVLVRTLDTTTLYSVVISNGYCSDTLTHQVKVLTTCQSACGACSVSGVGACTGALPKLCSSIAPATAAVPYSSSVTFYVPDTITVASLLPIPITIPGLPSKFAIDNAQIVVDNLPAGFTYSTDQAANNDLYNPSQDPSERYGCITICGTTCGPAGTNYMSVHAMIILPPVLKAVVLNLKASALGNFLGAIDTIVSVPVTGDPLTVSFANPLIINPPGNITVTLPQTDTTLSTSSAYAHYHWSTGDTTATITIDSTKAYSVTVTDTSGCTQVASKQVTFVTGINSIVETSLNIYPNPTEGIFNVVFNLAGSQNVSTQVFDVTGKVVYQNNFMGNSGSNTKSIDLGKTAKGIYVVKLTTNTGTVNRKITIE